MRVYLSFRPLLHVDQSNHFASQQAQYQTHRTTTSRDTAQGFQREVSMIETHFMALVEFRQSAYTRKYFSILAFNHRVLSFFEIRHRLKPIVSTNLLLTLLV
ncbi:unnamed protein product [Protopolystoma xenopodis]|uniref:Uncharacterized protein n=1 Tax=Protopolystoma xenopodis TaxID=117903 RepID=A0A3S5A1S5_9PLAT|nr:unnamed protein product [Protopolystoma xenopodis]